MGVLLCNKLIRRPIACIKGNSLLPSVSFFMFLSVPLQLCDLYENDCIFDKFDCCMNGTAKYVASGSYNNTFRVFGVSDTTDVTLEASRDPMRRRLQQQPKQVRKTGTGPSISCQSAVISGHAFPLWRTHTS